MAASSACRMLFSGFSIGGRKLGVQWLMIHMKTRRANVNLNFRSVSLFQTWRQFSTDSSSSALNLESLPLPSAESSKSGTLSEDDEDLKVPKAPTSHESPFFTYDEVTNKFINCMMWDGKKSVSKRIFKDTLEIIKVKQLAKSKSDSHVEGSGEHIDPLHVFHQALANAMPVMGTTAVKRGGKTYHVPVDLPEKRRRFLGIKWIITAARERKGMKMADKLAAELLDAYNSTGTAVKRKQDSHRLAEANRAFAHFRWS